FGADCRGGARFESINRGTLTAPRTRRNLRGATNNMRRNGARFSSFRLSSVVCHRREVQRRQPQTNNGKRPLSAYPNFTRQRFPAMTNDKRKMTNGKSNTA